MQLYKAVDFLYKLLYDEDSLEFSLISEETEFEPTKIQQQLPFTIISDDIKSERKAIHSRMKTAFASEVSITPNYENF
jgi:hypothetical protein